MTLGRTLIESGEGQARQQAVEQAREVLRDEQLLNRSARSAEAHRPFRQAITFDEVLLDHHQGLAGQRVVAMLLHDVLRRDRVCESARDGGVEDRADRLIRPLVVVGAAAAAEGHHEGAVPRGIAGVQSAGSHFGRARRVVEDRDPIDRAVDRAGLDADDVRHGLALTRRRLGDIGRNRRGDDRAA